MPLDLSSDREKYVQRTIQAAFIAVLLGSAIAITGCGRNDLGTSAVPGPVSETTGALITATEATAPTTTALLQRATDEAKALNDHDWNRAASFMTAPTREMFLNFAPAIAETLPQITETEVVSITGDTGKTQFTNADGSTEIDSWTLENGTWFELKRDGGRNSSGTN